jgi:HK97 family phage portal protein
MGLLQRMRTAVGVLKGNPLTEAMYLPWQSGTGVFRPKNYAEMVEAYRSWVYACASKIASSMAKLKLRLYVRKGRDREEIFEHPFLDMLRNVNPFMNRFELLELTTIFLELTGNAYWYIAKNKLGTPAEIWLMHSQFVKVVPDKKEFIRGYLWEMYGKKIAFSPEEVIHFKYPNPKSMYYGMGPLEAAAWGVDTNDYMQRYEAGLFKNQARPDGVLETEQSLNDPEFKRLQRMWVNAHQGVDKAGKTAILEKGLKYKAVQMSPRELGFLTGRKLTREEICAIFGVPLSKLGIVTDVNRANAEANDYTFQKEVILPKGTRMQEKIDEKVLPMYDSKLSSEFENPVPEDKRARTTIPAKEGCSIFSG